MILLLTRDESHHISGKCDASCYTAKNKKCTCICGGVNHGVGLEQAIENTQEFWQQETNRDDSIVEMTDFQGMQLSLL